VNLLHQRKTRRNERGQIWALLAAIIPVLIVFAGLAIDLGLAYVTKTTLSKAVDAAALAAMRNLNQGHTQATTIAQSAFNVNYQSIPGRDASPPVFNLVFTTDANNNTVINVSATATINTYFLRVMSGYNTLNVSTSAQAIRNPVIMSLVLDKSGSMKVNLGYKALPGAVTNFISQFDDATDQVAEVSFSSVATTDVTIRKSFTTPITNAANSMVFGGATYAQAGLQNGQTQIQNVTVAPGQNVIKVAVFFTDGWANTNQDKLNCSGKTLTLLNYGGCAPPEAAVGWCTGVFFLDPTSGTPITGGCGAQTFPAQDTGTNQSLTQTNISNDAMYRTVQLSNAMRGQNITIYSIGLGDKINQPYLQQVANDPASITFDATKPVGEAIFASTAADLQGVFQTIASKILLRLSQ
jgi:Flp pilus assembly protein TadG